MSLKVKNLLSVFVVMVLTAALFWGLGILVRPVDTDEALDAIDTFHTIPANSIEVVGFGSSHMWRGMDPMVMYQNYGIGAYNYGCNWQHINTTALFVRDAFRTQSPRVVLIDAYLAGSPLRDTDLNGEVYYTRNIPFSAGKWEYLNQCFGREKERYLSYFVPLAAFHDSWETLTSFDFRLSGPKAYIKRKMGFQASDGCVPVAIPNPATFPQEALQDDAVRILDDIVETCREHGASVIFFTNPWEGEYLYGDAMAEYAQSRDCVYLDFFRLADRVGIDGKTDFSDPGHLNTSGSAKVANYLGAYIAEHYDVTDLRTVPGNLWEQNLEN